MGTIITNYIHPENTSGRISYALERGIGAQKIKGPIYCPGPWAGFPYPPLQGVFQRVRTSGYDWWYVDHCYLDRTYHYRITRNAYQVSTLPDDGYHLSDENVARFATLNIKIQPWRRGGRYILLCPPDIDRHCNFVFGFSRGWWIATVLEKLRKYTDREIIMRDYTTETPLYDQLDDAHILVTAYSNVAVDALIYGVPVCCTHPCGAMPLATRINDIETPVYADNRYELFLHLCANQWTLDEISRGEVKRIFDNV